MKFISIATVGTLAITAVSAQVEEETKTIAELYADAIAEGGKLVVYAGGDTAAGQDNARNAWKAAFPGVNLTVIVDYSKYHDVRINNQLDRDILVPDVTTLQTLQDFPRWAERGELLEYKPAGFSQIYEKFKDPNGAWLSAGIFSFGFWYDAAQLGDLPAPTSPADLVDPKWANKIASAYPNDDDATLFVFKKYVEKYGWEWAEKFAAQQPEFNRGTNTPGLAVNAKRKVVGVGASITLAASTSTLKPVFGNGVPFLSWGQRLAIFKKAKHPAAAKLYVNWLLSKETQSTLFANRSTRKDFAYRFPNGNYTWDIPEANIDEFPKFMADRAEVERFRQTFSLYFGEVQGQPSPGWWGLLPAAP